MRGQRALVDGRVGHQRHLPRALPGQQVELDAAAAERVPHLVGAAGRAAGHGHQLLHVVQVEVAHAPVADPAQLLQPLEAFHRLPQRHVAAPVQQVQVDVVQLQPAPAALAGRQHALRAGVVRVDLATRRTAARARSGRAAPAPAPRPAVLRRRLRHTSRRCRTLGSPCPARCAARPARDCAARGSRPCARCPGRAPAARGRWAGSGWQGCPWAAW